MSISFKVEAVKAPDDQWKKMKKIYDACTEGQVEIPESVCDFFDHKTPDNQGVVLDIKHITVFVQKLKEDSVDGFIVDLKNLMARHPDVTHLKFKVSY